MAQKTKAELQALFDNKGHCFGDGSTYSATGCGGDDPCGALEQCPLWGAAKGDPEAAQAEPAVPAADTVGEEVSEENTTPPTDTEESSTPTVDDSVAPLGSREAIEAQITAHLNSTGVIFDVRPTTNRSKVFINNAEAFTIQRKGIRFRLASSKATELGLAESEWKEVYKFVYIDFTLGQDRVLAVLDKFIDLFTGATKAPAEVTGTDTPTTPAVTTPPAAEDKPEPAKTSDVLDELATNAVEAVNTVIEKHVTPKAQLETAKEELVEMATEKAQPKADPTPDTSYKDVKGYEAARKTEPPFRPAAPALSQGVTITFSVTAPDGASGARELRKFLDAYVV